MPHVHTEVPRHVRIDALGFRGWIGCEYKPATTTEAGLHWRQQLAKAIGMCVDAGELAPSSWPRRYRPPPSPAAVDRRRSTSISTSRPPTSITIGAPFFTQPQRLVCALTALRSKVPFAGA